MVEAQNNEVITSTVSLFVPLLLFSLITGVLTEISHWFGGGFVLIAVGVYATSRRIATARKVDVKPLEVTLLGLLIPIFAILSALSSFLYPQAKNTICFALMTLLIPHLALLWRMRHKMNVVSHVVTSTIQMGFGLAGTGFTFRKGPVAVAVNIAILAYAVFVKCGALGVLREKMPIRTLRWVWLSIAVFFTAVTIACYYLFSIHPILISMSIAITSAIMFAYLDYLINLMLIPRAEWWTFGSLPNLELAIKLLSVLIVTCFGEMGVLARSGTDFWSFIIMDLIMLFVAHLFLSATLCRLREKEPPRIDAQPFNKIATLGIAAILATIAVMISVAFYYCQSSHPTVVHESFLLMFAACLYLLLIYLIDCNRAFLTRYYGLLIGAASGVAVYIIINGFYWTSLPAWLVPSNASNSTMQTPDLTKETESDGGMMDIEPIKRATFVAVIFCVALVIHLTICLIFENKKRRSLASGEDSAADAVPTAPLNDCEYEKDETKERLLHAV